MWSGFSKETFELLSTYKANSKTPYQKEKFDPLIRDGFKEIIDEVYPFVNGALPEYNISQKRSLSSHANRQNQMHHHFWAALYRESLQAKQNDLQMFFYIAPDLFKFGMYIGDKVAAQLLKQILDRIESRNNEFKTLVRAIRYEKPVELVVDDANGFLLEKLSLDSFTGTEELVRKHGVNICFNYTPAETISLGRGLLDKIKTGLEQLLPLYRFLLGPAVTNSLPREPEMQRWLLALGESGDRVAECYRRNEISIAWGEVGDLKTLSKDQISEILNQRYPSTSSKTQTNNTYSLHSFRNGIQVGDIIYIKGGRNEIYGKVRVTGNYQFLKDQTSRNDYWHIRKCEWLAHGRWELHDVTLPISTLTGGPNANQETYDAIEKLISEKPVQTESKFDSKETEMPLDNMIFYGPPGTGKTFIVRERYLTLQEKPLKGTDEILHHPWYVIVALVIESFGGSATVPQITNHPLVVRKATVLRRTKNIPQTIWGNLQAHAIAESKTVKYSKRVGEPIFDKLENGSWHLPNGLPENYQTLRNLMETSEVQLQSSENFRLVTFHQSFGYEEFIEGIKPLDEDHPQNENGESLTYKVLDGVFKRACQNAIELTGFQGTISDFCALDSAKRKQLMSKAPPFNFCIDEINRGNCAQIFGEIITLIEPDKRLGAKQELIVELPYSGELFGVPANLRVIGTMNTADRSVEALDSALRRRFSFVEVQPNPDILSGVVGSVNLRELLVAINNRIEILADRDRTIGHGYLVDVKTEKDLKHTLKYKIIPLLQEYFLGDLEKVGLILGNKFVIERNRNKIQLAQFDSESKDDYIEKRLFELVDIDKLSLDDIESVYKNAA